MRRTRAIAITTLLLASTAFPQARPATPGDDQPIRISTELVQVDVVVTDKAGRVVRDLTKADFELIEKGTKQQISFFEFVEAEKSSQAGTKPPVDPAPEESQPAPTASEVRRIFGFVVDDLTIPYQDLIFVRKMLTNFVNERMQPTDLVGIVRTVGGKGLLQQFTSDKELLRRAIAALTLRTHPFSAFNNPSTPSIPENPEALIVGEDTTVNTGPSPGLAGADVSGETADISSALDDTNRLLRSFMSLGTASFVVESLKQLPGRKSLVLISGGLPILAASQASIAGNVAHALNLLADQATRAGVAIHTMDIRGLQAHAAIASFADTPGRSAVGETSTRGNFGRAPDESMFGFKNPFDQMEGHQGLRALAHATGGIPVLNKNDFDQGLAKILSASEGYYLLGYTPSNSKFDGNFRKIEVKVRGEDLKVYNRRGYMAREEKRPTAPQTKQEELLMAIRSPMARREIDLDAMLLYRAATTNQAAVEIHLTIDPRKLSFQRSGDKQQASYDMAGFVFDEVGKLRGGFSETVTASFSDDELKKLGTSGLPFASNTSLPAGIYQIRLAARDNNTGNIGTLSRYLEVPDLSKGKLSASSLLIGGVPANSELTANSAPVAASRKISRKQDLRYGVVIYNAKLKDGKPLVRTQLIISQGGKTLHKEAEEPVQVASTNQSQVIKIGQLGLSSVRPGRYSMMVIITDPLAEKKAQTVTRTMDFEVVN